MVGGKTNESQNSWVYMVCTWTAGNTAEHAQALVGVFRIVMQARALDALAQPRLLLLTTFNCVKLHLASNLLDLICAHL